MSQLEKFQEYLDTAASQIRWKRARPALARELRTHLLEQYDACKAAGLDEEAATAETLRQMGDAVEVGTALDRAHRPKPQWGLLVLTGVLAVVGLVVQYAIRNDTLYRGMEIHPFGAQLAATLLGIACMLGIYFLDYTALGKHPWLCYFALMGVIYCCFYERIFPFSLPLLYSLERQIFYLLCFAPVVYALAIYQLRAKGTWGACMALGALLPLLFASFFNERFGQVLMLFFTGMALLFLSIVKGWFGGSKKAQICYVLLPPLVLTACIAFYYREGIARCLAIFLHPALDLQGRGFAADIIGKYLEGARLVGSGTAVESSAYPGILQSYGSTDFFLTWVIHKLGWLAGIAVILLLVALLIWGFLVCRRQQNMLGRLLGTAVLLMLSFQTALYVAFNLGFMLFSVMSLPLLSYGKAYQVVNLALLGLLFSVFRGGASAAVEFAGQKSGSLSHPLVGRGAGHLLSQGQGRPCPVQAVIPFQRSNPGALFTEKRACFLPEGKKAAYIFALNTAYGYATMLPIVDFCGKTQFQVKNNSGC